MVQNLSAPRLQPNLPHYPLTRQIVRVASSLGQVAFGYVQQFVGPTPRDREPCYLLEPNGIAFSPGKYKARLIGSYVGPFGALPLLAVSLACCSPTGFGSSTSASPASLISSSLSSVSVSSLSQSPRSVSPSSLSAIPSSSQSLSSVSVAPSSQSISSRSQLPSPSSAAGPSSSVSPSLSPSQSISPSVAASSQSTAVSASVSATLSSVSPTVQPSSSISLRSSAQPSQVGSIFPPPPDDRQWYCLEVPEKQWYCLDVPTKQACCNGTIPEIVYLTFTAAVNGNSCAASLIGFTLPLIYDSIANGWLGSVVICGGHVLTFDWYCVPGISTGGCDDMRLDISGCLAVTGIASKGDPCSCLPVYWPTNLAVALAGNVCGLAADALYFVITE